MKVFLSQIFVYLLLIGCGVKPIAIIPNNIWSDLDPYKSGINRDAMSKIRKICCNENNRFEIIYFLKDELKSQKISHRDQIKLAAVMICLQDKAEKDYEKKEIAKLIEIGKKHVDFYGLALSVLPSYIRASLEVFKDPEPLIGHFVNPENGKKAEYNIQEIFLDALRRSTNQDFGTNYRLWIDWWDNKGHLMKFNTGKKIYY